MCPGGEVVASSSEIGGLVVNGMSPYKRDTGRANSALVVAVTPDDFPEGPLGGMVFQRRYEALAYRAAGAYRLRPSQAAALWIIRHRIYPFLLRQPIGAALFPMI